MRNTRTISTALALMACLTVASTAYADDPREQQAEPIYRDGVKLHDKGQEAEALEKFRQSYAVYPSPVALNAIARSELLLGRDLEAVRHFRQVLANPLTHPQTAQKARESVQELEARLGRVKVQAPEGTVFIIDGERYVAPVAAPIDVKPGEIRVEGTYGEARYEGAATAARGATVPLELKRVASAQSPVGEQPPPSGTEPSMATRNITAGVFGGLALVSIGIGVGFTVKSNGQVTDAKDYNQRVAGACSFKGSATCGQYGSMLDDVSASRNVALGAFIAGGALAALAGGMFLLWPSHKTSQGSVRPVVTGTGLGFVGTF